MFAEDLYGMVSEILAEVGTNATLSDPTGSEYDTETGEVIPTTTDYTVRVVVMDFALISNGGLVDKNSLRASQDKQVYLDGRNLPFKIQANKHTLTAGGTTYRITVVKEYNPSLASHIMYDLKVEI